MSVSISNLTTAETFSQWVSKTNSLISFANIAMTLDANNAGDVTLDGNFSLAGTTDKIYANNIYPIAGTGGTVAVTGMLDVTSDLTISVPDATEAKIKFKLNTAETWSIETTTDHSAFIIRKGVENLSIADDGAITSTGQINNDMLPTNVTLAGTLSVTSGSTLPTVDIGGGNVDGLTTLGTAGAPIASAVITSADINGGAIDGTAIGGSTAAAGSFTTIAASSNATVGGNLTVAGTITGDVTGTTSTANALNANAIAQVFNFIYPVGSVFVCDKSSSPDDLNLPGTWERVCEGRMVMGVDSGTTITNVIHDPANSYTKLEIPSSGANGTFDYVPGDIVTISGFSQSNGDYTVLSSTAYNLYIDRDVVNVSAISSGSRVVKLAAADVNRTTGGANAVTLTTPQLPAHTHLSNFRMENTSPIIDMEYYDSTVPGGEYLDHLDGSRSHGTTTHPTGDGKPVNITNRHQILALWKRIAL